MGKYREYRTCRTCNGLNVVTAEGKPGQYYWCPECNGAGKVLDGKPRPVLKAGAPSTPIHKGLQHYHGKPCPYCKQQMTRIGAAHGGRRPTRDHACVPRSRGGTRARGNIVICCEVCNGDKAALTIWEWLAVLERDGDPRAGNVRSVWQDLKPRFEAAYGVLA